MKPTDKTKYEELKTALINKKIKARKEGLEVYEVNVSFENFMIIIKDSEPCKIESAFLTGDYDRWFGIKLAAGRDCDFEIKTRPLLIAAGN